MAAGQCLVGVVGIARRTRQGRTPPDVAHVSGHFRCIPKVPRNLRFRRDGPTAIPTPAARGGDKMARPRTAPDPQRSITSHRLGRCGGHCTASEPIRARTCWPPCWVRRTTRAKRCRRPKSARRSPCLVLVGGARMSRVRIGSTCSRALPSRHSWMALRGDWATGRVQDFAPISRRAGSAGWIGGLDRRTRVDAVPAGAHRAERAVARRDACRARPVADRLNLIRFVPAKGEAAGHVPIVACADPLVPDGDAR